MVTDIVRVVNVRTTPLLGDWTNMYTKDKLAKLFGISTFVYLAFME